MKKFLMISALAVMAASPAMANDKEDWFKMMDTNKDGMVSKSEFAASNDEKFAVMDTDANGNLSLEEVKEGKDKVKEMKEQKKDAAE